MKTLGRIFALFLLSFFLQWLGAWSNIFVMAKNGGKMPVLILRQGGELDIMFDFRHTLLTGKTHYKPLCDIFPVPFPMNTHEVEMETMSIGDLLLNFGSSLMLLTPFLPIFVPLKGGIKWSKKFCVKFARK